MFGEAEETSLQQRIVYCTNININSKYIGYVYQILENNTFKLGPCALFYKLLEVT